MAASATRDHAGCVCLTEPHTGNASALRTTATRDGNDYVVGGTKQLPAASMRTSPSSWP